VSVAVTSELFDVAAYTLRPECAPVEEEMPREDHDPVTMSIHAGNNEVSKEGLMRVFGQPFVERVCCGDGSGVA
jgi:hypothetical protein